MSGVQHERIVALCDDLKFQAVADVYADLADVAAKQESSYIDFLEQVLKAENELRQGRSRHTMAKLAGFPAIKTLEDYDFDFATGAPKQYDVFISHASEDKKDIAVPLYNELSARGVRVWFDEATLQPGDSLTAKINDGLSNSRFGIVILSKMFFEKNWPPKELAAMLNRYATEYRSQS